MINKLRASFKVSILQISLAGILVAVGVIADTYIRIGHYTFLTTAIYIIIGLLLPLWLGITTAFIIDTLQLLFRGVLGYWYWSLQLEPAFIVMVTFMFRFLFTSIKSKKLMMMLSIVFLLGIVVGASTIIGMEHNQFSTNIQTHESSSGRISRLVRRYASVLGLVFIIGIIINEMIKLRRGKVNSTRMAALIIVVLVALVIDWVYHPWASYNWKINSLGMAPSIEIFRTHVITGIWNSTFHIAIGIPLVASIYYATKSSNIFNKNKY